MTGRPNITASLESTVVSCHDFLLRRAHAMRPLALVRRARPAAAALEVLRAEGSPHDLACGAAGVRRRPPTNLHRASRVASERVGPVRARLPTPHRARARRGRGQLVVHRQDGQHGSQTVRSSFSSSRRPRRARAAPPVPRARIPVRGRRQPHTKDGGEVSPHFVDWSGAQLFRILGRRCPGPHPRRCARARAARTLFVRSWRRKLRRQMRRDICARR